MEIILTDRVKNDQVLREVQEERECLPTIKRRKAYWIGDMLCRTRYKERQGMTEVKGRRGKGRRQLLNDVKESTRYWKPKAEALHRTLCKTRFGRCYVPTVRQTTGRMIFGFRFFVV
jgi:hypothetical protein